jgi:hypothetical protein
MRASCRWHADHADVGRAVSGALEKLASITQQATLTQPITVSVVIFNIPRLSAPFMID